MYHHFVYDLAVETDDIIERRRRCRSAFFFFCNEERGSVKGKFPDYGVGDIAKELGKRWGVNTEKPRFEAMALKDKTRYAKVSVGCARVDVTI